MIRIAYSSIILTQSKIRFESGCGFWLGHFLGKCIALLDIAVSPNGNRAQRGIVLFQAPVNGDVAVFARFLERAAESMIRLSLHEGIPADHTDIALELIRHGDDLNGRGQHYRPLLLTLADHRIVGDKREILTCNQPAYERGNPNLQSISSDTTNNQGKR